MNPAPEYLTKPHASVIYDLKPRSLEGAIRAGRVRAFKIGRKILIEKASIDQWIQAHEIQPVDRRVEKSELQKLMDRAIRIAREKTA